MNLNDSKALAENLEQNVEGILREFTMLLNERGFPDIDVVSFAVGHRDDKAKLLALAGTPCPTKCIVLPDGRIECRPVCS